MGDIVGSLRSLARFEHADLSIGNEAADEIERLRGVIKRQASSARTLQATTMQTVEHLAQRDRSEYHAAATLESEREANAQLTAETERLRTERNTAFLAGVKAGLEAAWHAVSDGLEGSGRRADAIRAIDPTTITPVTERADG